MGVLYSFLTSYSKEIATSVAPLLPRNDRCYLPGVIANPTQSGACPVAAGCCKFGR
jgi:hypothetical protein